MVQYGNRRVVQATWLETARDSDCMCVLQAVLLRELVLGD